jgi:hypothetical protein
VRAAWIPIVLLSTCPVRARASANSFTALAQNCKVKAVIASARVFSDNDENKWKEYASAKQVPYGEDWFETAYAWGTPNAPVVIAIEGGGEDFDESTYYCFDASGRLSIVEYEFRTAWEWGFAEHRQFDCVGTETVKSHFFSTKDRKEIPRPQGANDVHEAMTVKTYKRLSDVPFFSLLTRRTKAK